MVFLERPKRLLVVIMTILLLDCFSVGGFSFSSARDLVVLFFALLEASHIRTDWRQLRHTIIPWLLLIVIVGDIILIIHSVHLHSAGPMIGFIIGDLVVKYGALAYAFIGLSSRGQFYSFWKPIFIALIFMTFMGFVETVFNTSILHNLLGIDNAWRQEQRNRATSIFISPFDYGYINIVLLIYFLYCNRHKQLPSWVFYTALGCCLIGSVICGCRTVLATLLLVMATYAILAFDFFKNAGLAMTVVVLGALAYSYVPAVQEKADFLYSAIDPRSDVAGSSNEMRVAQYAATLYYVRHDMVFGRGYNFFNFDMGWAEGGHSTLRDKDLQGLEGVLMNYMLERGLVGVAFYLAFYTFAIVYFIVRRPRFKQEAACIVSLLIACAAFGNMTGELGAVLPTLLFIGMYYKIGLIRYGIRCREERKAERQRLRLQTVNQIRT